MPEMLQLLTDHLHGDLIFGFGFSVAAHQLPFLPAYWGWESRGSSEGVSFISWPSGPSASETLLGDKMEPLATTPLKSGTIS
jgi:hypothetical protein